MKNGQTMIECLTLIVGVAIIGIAIWSFGSKFIWGNKQMLDFKNDFNVAYVLGDDSKFEKINVAAWKDWKDSDAVQVVAKDGRVIYTHLRNVKLVKEERN